MSNVIDKSDVTPPEILITSPKDGVINGKTNIIGSISDNKELKSYEVKITNTIGDRTENVIASGESEINNGVIASVNTDNLENGVYRIDITAEDMTGLSASHVIMLTINKEKCDNIPPQALIDDIIFDKNNDNILIIGTAADETAFGKYELTLSEKQSQNEKKLIASGTSAINNAIIGNIETEKLETGTYIINLSAWDESGNSCNTIAEFTYTSGGDEINRNEDTTAPVIAGSLNAFINDKGLNLQLTGTIHDDKLKEYSVVVGKTDKNNIIISPITIANGTENVTDTNIAKYIYEKYSEGQYVLRVTATDSAGNKRTAEYSVTITRQGMIKTGDDTGEGEQSSLNIILSADTAQIGESVNAYLSYPESASDVMVTAENAEIIVNGKTAIIKKQTSGVVNVILSAVIEGERRTVSREIRFFDRTDQIPPQADFISPEANSDISTKTDIYADIYDETSLAYYVLEYKMSCDSGNYTEIGRGTDNVSNGKIGELDTTQLMNGSYILRLTIVDNGGNRLRIERTINVTGKLKIGSMSLGFTDINSKVAGLPLTITRNYDSRNKSSSDFGTGWTMGVQSAVISESSNITQGYNLIQQGDRLTTCYQLEQTVCHDITVTYGDGTSDRFELKVTPERSVLIPINEIKVNFQCVTDKKVKLELNGDNSALIQGSQLLLEGFETDESLSYILTRADGTKLYLNTEYGLTKMEDANGNMVSITKSGYRHSSGNSILFTRDELGRITKAEEKNSKGKVITAVRYAYDDSDNLVSVTDTAGRTVTFTYDDDHNLVNIIDPSGIAVARNIYDEDGRLIATIDADGNRTSYEHDLDAKMEVIRDKMGNATVYYYDDNGNVLKTVDALGNVTENTYNEVNQILEKTDANGNVTGFSYDDNKNLSTLTTAEGIVESVSYSQLNLVTGVSLDGQQLADFDYDENGNLTQMEDSLGNSTEMTYDTSGRLLGITDEIGTVQGLTYDSDGQPVSMTDGNGNTTRYNYNADGQCTGVTVNRTDADGVNREYTSIYTYDTAGNILTVTSPSGEIITNEYDFRNNKTASMDSAGNRTQYNYDSQNNLTLVTYSDGTTEKFTYDANGNAITATSRMGVMVTNTYDSLNRLIKKAYADGAEESYTYDANSNVLTHTLTSGGVISYTYDCMNRNTSITDAYGNVTAFEYNERSLLTKQTDALGNIFEYQYDDNGNQIKTIYPDGAFEETEYDARNRVAAKTDRNGNKTEYSYDDADNLTKVKDANGKSYIYTYDETYELTKVTDANGNTVSYEYDADGRLSKITNALGNSYTYSYDDNGYQTGYTDFGGNNTTYTYDNNNRITSIIDNNGTTNFAYDALGRIITVTDVNGTITYSYDSYGRLSSKSTYDYGTLSYTYNNSDEISGIQTSVNGVMTGNTSYEYDFMDRITRVVGHDGSATLYEYDAIGNRTKVRHEGGLTVDYQYDTCSRLVNEIVTDTDGSILMYYGYTYGNAGEKTSAVEVIRASKEDTDARIIKTEYAYDKLLRLTDEVIHVKDNVLFGDVEFNNISSIGWSGSIAYQYSYDAVSNRTAKTIAVTGNVCGLDEDIQAGTTEYTYNELNQLVSAEFTDGQPNDILTTSYTYDLNGNLLSEHGGSADKVYTYNAKNQLITATVSSGNAVTIESYSYDYEGNRITKQVNEEEKTYYLNDTNGELTQVVLELRKNTDNTYAVKKYYTRGTELISADITADDASIVRKMYIMDGHGSVTALAQTQNTSNIITDIYIYDAYGNLLRKTGDADNDYLYTGEQYNELTKLYYLRARYMSPETGTFTSMDSYAGSLDNPVSLHKYLYANANPVMYTDPTGNFSLMETSVAQGIQATINDVIVPYFNVKKIMSWANLAVTAYDVAGQVRLIMSGEANILGLTIAIAKGMITQALITCAATAVLGEAAATVLKIVGVAQDAGSFVEAVKSGDPEKIIVESLRLSVSVFTLSCQCFTGNTLVSTEEGDRRIDEIEAGDRVFAYNTETGERELREVIAVSITETDILVHVTLSDGEEIETTMFHPFYVQDEESESGIWMAASNLVSGDKLLMEDGQSVYVEEVRIEKLAENIKVYNLEIEGLHTYFVGDGVLVHNECAQYEGDDESSRTSRVGKSNGKTPRDNSKQNKQIKNIAKKFGLDNDDLEMLHELISHQGYSYQEIMDIVEDFFGK